MIAIHDLLRAIGIVALAIVALVVLAFAVWLIGLLRDGRKRREDMRLARRVTEDEERARLMGDQFDGTRAYDEDYKGPGGRA